MNRSSHGFRISGILLSLVTGASLLTACGRDVDEGSARQNADQTVANAERRAESAATEARRDMGNAAGAVASKSKDLAITAEVKSKLARDERLSALAINVDTDGGRVVLRGSAPDTEARAHAAELAKSVDGVVAVNNELNVQRSN